MRSLGLIMLFFFLLSCQDIEKTERPQNLIPENKMVEILTELSLINSAKNVNKKVLEDTGFKPDKFLFEKFDIDSLQLLESTDYYARNYAQFERMYEKVQRNLEAKKSELEVVRLKEEQIRDSIQQIEQDGDSIIIDSTKIQGAPRDSLIIKPLSSRNRREQL